MAEKYYGEDRENVEKTICANNVLLTRVTYLLLITTGNCKMLTEENLIKLNTRKSTDRRSFFPHKEAPKIVIVLDEKFFVIEKTICGVRRSKSRAQILENEVKKKTKSALVISMQTACSDEWKGRLNPKPRINMAYAKHPYDDKPYIALRKFHDVIMNQKKDEMFYILSNLGAKSIALTETEIWSTDFESPGLLEPELKDVEEMWFLPKSPQVPTQFYSQF